MHQRVRQPFAHGQLTPRVTLDDDFAFLESVALRDFEQPFGAVGAAVEDDVLDAFAQFRIEVVVDRQRAGVDDAHVHAGLDRVIEKYAVDRLTHRLVAAEGKRHIRNAARHMAVRQGAFDLTRRFDEIDRVVVVFLDAGRDGEDVRIEDDVFRRKSDFFRQQFVCARTDFHFARFGIGLALLVEGHDDDSRTVREHLARVLEENLFAFLQRNRIDHAFALQTAQTRFDHRPFRRIDHHGHARDVRLGSDEVEIFRHRHFGIDQALVHVDVEDLRAVGDLLARDFDGFVVAIVLDELFELRRTCDVGALADVDEQQFRRDDQRFEAGQARVARTNSLLATARHSRESGNPAPFGLRGDQSRWIPAFAGMTEKASHAAALACCGN